MSVCKLWLLGQPRRGGHRPDCLGMVEAETVWLLSREVISLLIRHGFAASCNSSSQSAEKQPFLAATILQYAVMSKPQGQTGLQAKILASASASASSFWPRASGLGRSLELLASASSIRPRLTSLAICIIAHLCQCARRRLLVVSVMPASYKHLSTTSFQFCHHVILNDNSCRKSGTESVRLRMRNLLS